MDLVSGWQSRPLDRVYAVIWLDAIYVKIRESGHVVNKAIYVAIGLNMQGHKEALGLWTGKEGSNAEGAKFWLQVLTELNNRGVKDVYIAPSKIEALNKLQTGMLVKLKEVNKRRCPVWSTIARPIIISAGEPIQISSNQINIEINEANSGDNASQLFGALLSMMVTVLNQIFTKPTFEKTMLANNPQPPPNILEFANAPYT